MNKSKPIIAIAGFGVEGRATYEFLKNTAEIHIFDEEMPDLDGVNAPFHKGLSIPAHFNLVYKTPGIPTYKIKLESSSTRVTTLMDSVLSFVGKRAIGITGTKGKSTVASLVQHILVGSGRDTVLFGNIGVADMGLVHTSEPNTIFVIELSSYQCEYLTHSPHIAVLTNLYPEHLTHHGSFEAYRDAKLNIARFQKTEDVFINASDIETSFAGALVRPRVVAPFETKLIGEHNQMNCAVAVATVATIGIDEDIARQHIRTFKPLPYRLEQVGTFGGIIFYDDSLATIPEATLASVQALGKVDTLILGGEDRGIYFDNFTKTLAESRISTFIIFPDTGERMVRDIKGRKIISVTSMQEAVTSAYRYTPNGGVVLLSNASPSFNLFKDYKDKSAQYRHWIHNH